MLRDLPRDKQHQVVGSIWTAIGIDPGSITDELLDEWADALAELSREDINRGIDYWKARGCTCPADEFAESCRPKPSSANVVHEHIARMQKLYGAGESEMTLEEAYNFLGLNKRWGPLPAERRNP